MTPMSPTTRSCAANAVATSALHDNGKGGSGSGKGGSGGGKGGSGSSKGKSGGGTELFDTTSAAMSPTSPTPGRKSVAAAAGAHYKLNRSGGAASGSAAKNMIQQEARIVIRMIGSAPRRVIGSSKLMMVESAAPTWTSGGVGSNKGT